MRLRIARKICKYMGHGYPINNRGRLNEVVRIWHKACKRFKHFKRNEKMKHKERYDTTRENK